MNDSQKSPSALPGVVLVGVDLGLPHFDAALSELAQLAETAGYRVVDRVACKRRAPDPALFIGSGKADLFCLDGSLGGIVEFPTTGIRS